MITTIDSKQRRFFYAELEAGMYDCTIQNVVPLYSQMHETMIDTLRVSFRCGEGVDPGSVTGTFLDLGAGTGAETIGLLKAFPSAKVLAVDFCEPMGSILLEKCRQELGEEAANRCSYLNADILSTDSTRELLREELQRFGDSSGAFRGILSCLTFHHFRKEQKRSAYKLCFDLLHDDGAFVNGDLFNYESKELSGHALCYDIDYIREQFRLAAGLEGDKSMAAQKLRELGESWRLHYLQDNHPDTLSEQEQMLKNIGFRESGSPFRFWQVGVLWGRK